MADEQQTGHHWERMAGRDFREDIPPSFEWWRKFVYEPAHEDMHNMIAKVDKRVDMVSRLLWGLLGSTWIGFASIVAIVYATRPR